jgi:hypothetical protein
LAQKRKRIFKLIRKLRAMNLAHQDPVARRLSFSMCTTANAEDTGSHDIEAGCDDSILNDAFLDSGEGDDAESLDSSVSWDASTQCGLSNADDDELDPSKPASDNAKNDLDRVRACARAWDHGCKNDLDHGCNFEVSDSKLGQELKTYSACLLSGDTILELQGSDTVFSARLMIASALRIGVQYVQLFNCELGSLNDGSVLSELLGSDEHSVSVVVVEDTRKKQKLGKAEVFCRLGSFQQARELLESIGAVSEAKSLLENTLENIAQQDLPEDPRLAKVQHELDRLATNPYLR